ncbi:MAG: hypothetical protein JF586_07690 [Burkholderiales bacterium]|nr:hypothetical protein [Burkholderiales bacterium]
MNRRATILLACVLLAIAPWTQAAGAAAAPNDSKIVAAVDSMTDAANRTFGKSTAYCAANHLPAGQALDERLKGYLAAMSAGTLEAMRAIASKDPLFVESTPLYGAKDFEMMDRQAESMLQSVKASPAQACAKLGTVFDSGSAAFFKDFTQQGYQEYTARRARFCARSPKPANCK